MKTYLSVLKKYAVFNGRAGRREYWMFYLINLIISLFLQYLDATFMGGLIPTHGRGSYGLGIFAFGPLSFIYLLFIFLPELAVSVRRLHDIGKSGWWMFIILIPIVGAIWLIVLLASRGSFTENEYGPSLLNFD